MTHGLLALNVVLVLAAVPVVLLALYLLLLTLAACAHPDRRRIDGRFQGTEPARRFGFDRHREPAMNPRVRHVGPDYREVGFLAEDCPGEIIEGAEVNLHARQGLGGLLAEPLHFRSRRRSMVITRHHHGQVMLAGPPPWRSEVGAVNRGVVAENT